MAYFHLETFKGGLDTRRSDLTSLPGTLAQCQDCHIDQGGGVEKRKALVWESVNPTYFGLEGLETGLTVFGSLNGFNGAAPAQPVALPANLMYQQLVHPGPGLSGIPYNATYHAMTGVRWSSAYLGKSVVLATFADGHTFLYYNGSVVVQSSDFIVFNGAITQSNTNTSVNNELKNMLSQAFPPPDIAILTGTGLVVGTNVTTNVELFSSVTFTVIPTLNSAAGTFAFFNAGPVASVPGIKGTVAIVIAGGAGDTYYGLAPFVDLTSDATNFVTSTMRFQIYSQTYDTSLILTATHIAAEINAGTATHGYSAATGGTATVTISSPLLAAGESGTLTYNVGTFVSDRNGSNTNTVFSNSTFTSQSYAQLTYFAFGGTWLPGDTWSLTLVTSGGNITLGDGDLGPGATFGDVYNTQIFLANGDQFNFSAPGDPTGFEQQDVNAGFLPFTSQYGGLDAVEAFASFQGQLAVFGRRSVQIWAWDADPALQRRVQTLANIGTLAPLSVVGLGDLDVMFLSDTGIRSLRARNASNNAFVNDIGSPIDALVVPTADACGGVDPQTGRYWLYTDGVIYVLSYYPTNKIVAWSTYVPNAVVGTSLTVTFTGNGMDINSSFTINALVGFSGPLQIGHFATGGSAGQAVGACAQHLAANVNGSGTGYIAVDHGDGSVTITKPNTVFVPSIVIAGSVTWTLSSLVNTFTSFVPQKFLTYQNRLYIRTANSVIVYGGIAGDIYDETQAIVQTPWLDAKKPDTVKGFNAVDAVLDGNWAMSFGTDWIDDTLQPVIAAVNKATFDQGAMAVQESATHFAFRFVSSAAVEPATLSQVIAVYQPENEPA